MHSRCSVFLVVFGLCAAACADDGGSGGAGGTNSDPEVTFHRDVEPLLQAACLDCHAAGQVAPDLSSFESVSNDFDSVLASVESGRMPPFQAVGSAGCQTRLPWRDDPRLTGDALATLQRWAELGKPKGDAEDAPPPFVASEPTLEGANVTLQPGANVAVDGPGTMCVVFDPKFTERTFVQGLRFVPDQRAKTLRAALYETTANDIDVSGKPGAFPCNGAGANRPPLLQWTPGAEPLVLPPTAALDANEDTLLLARIDYLPSDTAFTDVPTLELRSLVEPQEVSAVRSVLRVWTVGGVGDGEGNLEPGPNDEGGPEFRIPANVAGHTERFTLGHSFTREWPMLFVAGDMGVVGTELSVSIERGMTRENEQPKECLLGLSAWDADLQRSYVYDGAVTFYEGDAASLPVAAEHLPTWSDDDLVSVTCTYDNTLANPQLVSALNELGLDAPVEVTLKGTPIVEKCLAHIGLLEPLSGI